MLSRFRVRNFKCLDDVSLELGAFNVLIGPNDSGKSSVLEALRVLHGLLRSGTVAQAFVGGGLTPHAVLRHGAQEGLVEFEVSIPVDGVTADYAVALDGSGKVRRESLRGLPQPEMCYTFPAKDASYSADTTVFSRWLAMTPAGPAEVFSRIKAEAESLEYSLDPQKISQASEPAQGPDVPRLEPTGEKLPSVLDYLALVERDAFDLIQGRLCALVPYIRQIRVSPIGGKRQIAFVTTRSNDPIYAPMASDGLLLFLAYLTLLHLPRQSPRILLIDEPENGIHPRRLEEVVKLLRELTAQEHVQVIMTTHSPYLLDWVEPEEVHILMRGDDLGTTATRMSSIPDIEVLRKGYQLGELWYNYGEAELVGGVK